MNELVLSCRNVAKNYSQGPQIVEVLKNVELSVKSGEHVAIIGASGSGKSTLLNVLGGLDKPDTGNVEILGKPFSGLNDNQRGKVRNQSLGFVYQFHHLLPEFSAQENIAMPLLIAGVDKKQALAEAEKLLRLVGLEKRMEHKPSELSGGERQRVAIARSLANQPACVLMDEPTGNLDSKNGRAIQLLMQQLSQELATSFVVVTHDEHFAKTMDVIYLLDEGELNAV
ncbi:ABC transporter ATP-binding protein [Teredinibacter haidensis]|uniref:ABC transporter ATP-binding protein n=1 Tax=Teredinibacter haidensis TaxID=2731755 RepID=UPI000948EB9D|nr:ABC transporter ATP-binding protein [Teredinibacter haidensis]